MNPVKCQKKRPRSTLGPKISYIVHNLTYNVLSSPTFRKSNILVVPFQVEKNVYFSVQ